MVTNENVQNDTDRAAEHIYLTLLRDAPAWRKAAMIDSLTRTCQELAIAGIRVQHPHATEREILMRFAALWLDRELMTRVFDWDPVREGY